MCSSRRLSLVVRKVRVKHFGCESLVGTDAAFQQTSITERYGSRDSNCARGDGKDGTVFKLGFCCIIQPPMLPVCCGCFVTQVIVAVRLTDKMYKTHERQFDKQIKRAYEEYMSTCSVATTVSWMAETCKEDGAQGSAKDRGGQDSNNISSNAHP